MEIWPHGIAVWHSDIYRKNGPTSIPLYAHYLNHQISKLSQQNISYNGTSRGVKVSVSASICIEPSSFLMPLVMGLGRGAKPPTNFSIFSTWKVVWYVGQIDSHTSAFKLLNASCDLTVDSSRPVHTVQWASWSTSCVVACHMKKKRRLLSFSRRYLRISTCEWAGVSGSEREWAGVSGSEREWAGMSMDRCMNVSR